MPAFYHCFTNQVIQEQQQGAYKQPIRMKNGFAHFAHSVSSLCAPWCRMKQARAARNVTLRTLSETHNVCMNSFYLMEAAGIDWKLPQCSWAWNSIATLPTVNLIRLQLVEQAQKCEQRGVGTEAAVGQSHRQLTVSSRRRHDFNIRVWQLIVTRSLFSREDWQVINIMQK